MPGVKWLGLLLLLLTGCAKAPLPPVTPATATDVLNAVHHANAKVVLVNMWASWCGPCREEFPDLLRLQRDYAARGLKVLLVSWDDTAEEAAQFLAKAGVTMPSFIKAQTRRDEEFLQAFAPNLADGIPKTLLYDATGKLRTVWVGATTYAEFEQRVNAVLNAP